MAGVFCFFFSSRAEKRSLFRLSERGNRHGGGASGARTVCDLPALPACRSRLCFACCRQHRLASLTGCVQHRSIHRPAPRCTCFENRLIHVCGTPQNHEASSLTPRTVREGKDGERHCLDTYKWDAFGGNFSVQAKHWQRGVRHPKILSPRGLFAAPCNRTVTNRDKE